MGGGGGVFGGKYNPERYKEILRDAQSKSSNKSFETEANGMVDGLLAEYSRNPDRTTEHLELVKNCLEDGIDGTLELRFGGSVHKHTYVDGLSDVDVLVIINNSELANGSPKEILNYIKDKIEKSNLQGVSSVKIGDLAVTVTFSDGEEIQLLPALKQETGYKIANRGSNSWSGIIRPEKFANRLTEVNQSCGGKVVPVVKLAKDIIYSLPSDQQLKGYHIESLAVEIFKDYPSDKPRIPRQMLKDFFEGAAKLVNSPINDQTGQSLHVDDYLGNYDSVERRKIGYALNRIYNRMKNADNVHDVDEWKSILGL